MIKDLMIILCIQLVILTLISILGGSIRYTDGGAPQKFTEPQPRDHKRAKSEKFEESAPPAYGNRLSSKLNELLSSYGMKGTDAAKPADAAKSEQYQGKKNGKTVEGFEGLEYAMF
jgi:hypothetical protein